MTSEEKATFLLLAGWQSVVDYLSEPPSNEPRWMAPEDSSFHPTATWKVNDAYRMATGFNEFKARIAANKALAELGKTYHNGLPLAEIGKILSDLGFDELEAVYCGDEGRDLVKIAKKSWLNLTWYKMPSGRFEIVAYVN